MATPLEQIQATLEAKGFPADDIQNYFSPDVIQLAHDLVNIKKPRCSIVQLNEVLKYLDFTMADDMIPQITKRLNRIPDLEILNHNQLFADKFLLHVNPDIVIGTRYFNQCIRLRLESDDPAMTVSASARERLLCVHRNFPFRRPFRL